MMQDKLKEMGILIGPDKFLTRQEIMALIGRSRPTVDKYIKDGKLPQPTVMGLFREIDVIECMTKIRQPLV